MKVICDEQIFNAFPEAAFYGVVFEDVQLLTEKAAAEWKRRAAESISERAIKPELLAEHPAIREWRAAYQKFGLKPSKFRSSVEQLYKRALKGNLIETSLPLVNLYCYISILHMIPAGGYDLSKIDGDITIRPANSGEEFRAIGERDVLPCQPGVVCYTDDTGVICYGWNYRDAARTCLDDKTAKAIFFVDSAASASRPQAQDAISDLSEALKASDCGFISEFRLDAQRREVAAF